MIPRDWAQLCICWPVTAIRAVKFFVMAEAAKLMARPIDTCDLQTFEGAAIHAPTFFFAKAVIGPIATLIDMT